MDQHIVCQLEAYQQSLQVNLLDHSDQLAWWVGKMIEEDEQQRSMMRGDLKHG
jgi:hypothetical protein